VELCFRKSQLFPETEKSAIAMTENRMSITLELEQLTWTTQQGDEYRAFLQGISVIDVPPHLP
jgi:hypothetical protein